jgi:hypothetical protein
MDKIAITGIGRAYDGEYDFDPSYFTNKELHTIKRMTGVRAGEIQAAFGAGDNDMIVAFASIALERAGKSVYEETLWNAKVGCIELVSGTPQQDGDGDDADPPTIALEEKPNEENDPSGLASSDDSAHQENGQSRTGIQPSELSAASGSQT